jgi:phosphatidylglycerophosphatase C
MRHNGEVVAGPAGKEALGNRQGRACAVFDFDKTIVSKDTGAAFIASIIHRSWLRVALAGLATPLAFALIARRTTRKWGISVYLWIGTCGLSEDELRAMYARFAEAFFDAPIGGRAFAAALDAIREQDAAGRQLVVMSGSFDWLVRDILSRIAPGQYTIVASTHRRFMWGFVVDELCVGQQKVQMALSAKVPNGPWDAGYSDSAWDIPMLRNCRTRYVVNPSNRTQDRFKSAFGADFNVVRWR